MLFAGRITFKWMWLGGSMKNFYKSLSYQRVNCIIHRPLLRGNIGSCTLCYYFRIDSSGLQAFHKPYICSFMFIKIAQMQYSLIIQWEKISVNCKNMMSSWEVGMLNIRVTLNSNSLSGWNVGDIH
jgi:hypothetical protein